MATVQPTDIGLATYNDVGDVSKLKTAAENLVGAVNELYDNSGNKSSIGTQLLVEGENNIIAGRNNIVKGNNNIVFGNNNVVIGDNLFLIESSAYKYNHTEYNFDSVNVSSKSIYYYWTREWEGGEKPALPVAVGDKVVLNLEVVWSNSDYSDYITIDTNPYITKVTQIDETTSTIKLENMSALETPPDEEHTMIAYSYASLFVGLNDNFKLTNSGENAIIMGSQATGMKSMSVNNGYATGSNSFAANMASAEAYVSAAFGSGKASGNYAFAANASKAPGPYASSFGNSIAYASYSLGMGTSTKALGRILEVSSADLQAKTFILANTVSSSQILNKNIVFRYRTSSTSYSYAYCEGTITSVTNKTIKFESTTSFSSQSSFDVNKIIFVNDNSTSYSGFNIVGGNGSIAAGKYSGAFGMSLSAINEGAVILGKYGTTDSDYSFSIGNGSNSFTQGLAFKVENDGNVYADGAYSSPCADYAEFFEWDDGNPNNEDRVGFFVKLKEGKIVKCEDFDKPLGIVSAMPAIVGDSGELHWRGKFVTDDFGRIQYHEVTVPEEKDEEGNVICEEHTEIQPMINPEWNYEQEYIPRNKRPEWSPVGVLGKLIVYDDGTLKAGDICRCGADGKAVKSVDNGYQVLKRIADDKILIWFKE